MNQWDYMFLDSNSQGLLFYSNYKNHGLYWKFSIFCKKTEYLVTMICVKSATICCILLTIFCPVIVHSHALPAPKVRRIENYLRMEPTEAIVFPGENVTFMCFHPSNVTLRWDFNSEIHTYKEERGRSLDTTEDVVFYSRIVIYAVSRRMSGEIICSAEGEEPKAIGFLIVNGVQNGLHCRKSSDCVTDKATCQDEVCECPRNYVRLRIKDRGFDVCREMIYSLYDPCDYNEQCTHLVDPKSICKSVCVCGPTARDRRGKCVSQSEISYNRSQEMYRVGLIAVTCIIILIVAVSLWVTLKRSCREFSTREQRAASITNRLSVDIATDKPPSYEDALDTQDNLSSPPNIKDALKHSMTAKRLLRQVSAPAGQLLPFPIAEYQKSAAA